MNGGNDLILSMDTMMRDLARLQFLLRIVESEASIFADDKGRVLYAGSGIERLLHWKASDLIGRPLTTIIPPRYHRAHLNGFARVTRSKTGLDESKVLYGTVHFEAVAKDGTEVPVDISAAGWRSAEGRLYFAARLEARKP